MSVFSVDALVQGGVYTVESPPETLVETQWGPASWYFMQDGKSPPGQSQNEKIPPLLSVPCCVRWVPHKLAPGCQMLTWEISPTLHFHSLLPPLKKMGELGGGKGHPVDEFLQKLALVTVLEIHFLKALVCVCERALFCTLDQVLFSPPGRELFILGPETFRRRRRRGCHAWRAVSPMGWELRGQTGGGSGLCGSAPWQGPLRWLVQRQARISEMASQRSRGQAGQELRAVSGWRCWVFFLLASSIQLCGFELALPLQKKARGDTEERTSPVARLPS